MRKYLLLAVPLALLLSGVPAQAATIQIGSITANDYFDWGQFPEFSTIASGQVVNNSTSTRTATISDGAPGFTALVEGSSFIGNFTPGDNLLFSGNAADQFNAANSFTVAFNTAVAGFGLQLTSNFYGTFNATVEAFNGATSLGVANIINGVMDGAEDGLAPFLGLQSDAVDITSAVFTLTSNTGAGFAVNRLLTTDTPFNNGGTQPVPEPGTLGLLGLGALALVRMRRNQKA